MIRRLYFPEKCTAKQLAKEYIVDELTSVISYWQERAESIAGEMTEDEKHELTEELNKLYYRIRKNLKA